MRALQQSSCKRRRCYVDCSTWDTARGARARSRCLAAYHGGGGWVIVSVATVGVDAKVWYAAVLGDAGGKDGERQG